jgi:hypothetical protein
MAPNIPRAPDAGHVCHFLQLPAELRNMIYAFALSEPNGLTFLLNGPKTGQLCIKPASVSPALPDAVNKSNKSASSVHPKPSCTANQLQYVSHQLRHETRGLGSRYNDLTFRKHHDFLAFMDMCPAAHKQHLRQLTVEKPRLPKDKMHTPERDAAIAEIKRRVYEICTAYPKLTLRMIFPEWRQDDAKAFVIMALALQKRAREKWSLTQFYVDAINQESVRIALAATGVDTSRAPPNMRIMPEDEPFDEALFRKAMQDDDELMQAFSTERDDVLDRWVKGARQFYEDGG